MADSSQSDKSRKEGEEQDKRLDVLDEDLDIMEKHATEIDDIESSIQEDMKRWDREYKDGRLHSVPSPRKHRR
ncbi:MAG TPA: hypothetical protein VJ882_00215 [Desulfuromonadales bacterium]|nr:hypothetical protein [Desulfuromonadales bacterium]